MLQILLSSLNEPVNDLLRKVPKQVRKVVYLLAEIIGFVLIGLAVFLWITTAHAAEGTQVAAFGGTLVLIGRTARANLAAGRPDIPTYQDVLEDFDKSTATVKDVEEKGDTLIAGIPAVQDAVNAVAHADSLPEAVAALPAVTEAAHTVATDAVSLGIAAEPLVPVKALAEMTKAELFDTAKRAGIEIPEFATATDLIGLLTTAGLK